MDESAAVIVSFAARRAPKIAVGASSSLAIETALKSGMRSIGLVRGGRFDVYAGGDRLIV